MFGFSLQRIKEWFTTYQPLDTIYISGSIEKVELYGVLGEVSLLRTLFSRLNDWITELDPAVCGDASSWWCWWCWQSVLQ